eukprot:TRINITY_DN2703_c0_g2_i1.p3 TRINITY_DN2703_c0_g2~~TRINITY_DN2703_c0_g2_i1.p3  ORF type:complete len:100 (+),score=0.15 TRINITY_DN2703_c0_g2_i1:454-753(+)
MSASWGSIVYIVEKSNFWFGRLFPLLRWCCFVFGELYSLLPLQVSWPEDVALRSQVVYPEVLGRRGDAPEFLFAESFVVNRRHSFQHERCKWSGHFAHK